MNLLAVDIGNTDIKFGVFIEGTLSKQWRATGTRTHPEKFSALLRDSLSRSGVDFNGVVYTSVVPEVEAAFRKTLAYCYNLPESAMLAIRPSRIRLPVDFSRYPLEQLGMDRLVNACSARLLYPEQNLVLVDFGTATTLDLVSREGHYLGGAITPGLQTFSGVLSLATSRLPAIEWTDPLPERLGMGLDTRACMEAGLGIGYRGLMKELLTAAAEPFEGPVRYIATGGLAATVIRLCDLTFDDIDPALTLKGLYGLYHFQHQPRSPLSV